MSTIGLFFCAPPGFSSTSPVAVGAVLVRVGSRGDADGAALARVEWAAVVGPVAGGCGWRRGRGQGGGGARRRSLAPS